MLAVSLTTPPRTFEDAYVCLLAAYVLSLRNSNPDYA